MYTALVVDDIQAYRDAFTACLVKLQWNVIQAEDGVQAMDILRQHPVDLIFLDYSMPRMNGFQLLEELQSSVVLLKPPVIMTSSDSVKNQIAVAQYGCLGSVTKPPVYDEVAKAVMRARQFEVLSA